MILGIVHPFFCGTYHQQTPPQTAIVCIETNPLTLEPLLDEKASFVGPLPCCQKEWGVWALAKSH